MTTCLSQVALEYVSGGSDKIYIIQVQEAVIPGTGTMEYCAVGYYGRRGSSLAIAEKYKGPVRASAESAAAKLERDKRSKSGYSTMAVAAGTRISGMPSDAPVFGGASAPAATPTKTAKAVVGTLPMLATTTDDATVQSMLADPNFVTQSKYDGERMLVSVRRAGITATNRKGEARPLPGGAHAEITKLLALPDFGDDRETVLDGEIMGDSYVAYDVVTLRDTDVRRSPFVERYCALEELLTGHEHLLAPTSWTEEEKRKMLAQAESLDWEGLMFRQIFSAYSSGRTSNLIKHKLWATVTCRVLTANAQRSIQVALRNEADVEVFVGNVTVPSNQDIPEPDSLVNIRYLYCLDGGSLYQPTLLHVRDDIDDADCIADLRKAPPEKRGLSADRGGAASEA